MRQLQQEVYDDTAQLMHFRSDFTIVELRGNEYVSENLMNQSGTE